MSDLQESAQRPQAWSDTELSSSVQAYLLMLRLELAGERYSKADVNRQLRKGSLITRSQASVEFRMQNISAALYELKMPWITGYPPARNIGSAVKEKIIASLFEEGIDFLDAYIATSHVETLHTRVSELRQHHLGRKPLGSPRPLTETRTVTTHVRDPAVKAWVLQLADGVCEGCRHKAPFIGQDGLPYLEVHHVMPLACHGSDTPSNAVALCPNCHRRCHYALDRDQFKLELYENIPRLILEVPEPIQSDTDVFINPDVA